MLFMDFGVISIFLLIEMFTLSFELLVMCFIVWFDDERLTLLAGRFLLRGFLGGDGFLGLSRD
jgi:hypothetical protein